MDALIEYLNNLFHGVKETPEVLRAKAELLQMMEDKYEELLAEGKNEDEAVGIVISEFGNFEEIAEELGIGDAVKKDAKEESAAGQNNGKKYRRVLNWTLDDVTEYMRFARRHARMIAFAVFLCIMAPYLDSVLEAVLGTFAPGVVEEAISSSMFFFCIAGAVALFIIAAQQTKRYGQVNKDAVILNGGAVMEMEMTSDEWAGRRTACIVAGIVLIILGPVASSFDKLLPGFIGEIVSCSVLLFTACGVGFLVYASSVSDRIKELSKGCKRAENAGFGADTTESNDDSGAEAGMDGVGMAAGTDNGTRQWNYRPRKGIPTWALILIIIGIFFALNTGLNILRGARIFGLGGIHLFGQIKTEQYDGTKTFNAGSLDKICVNLSQSELIVEQGTGDDVEVSFSGSFYGEPEIKQSGRELSVEEQEGFHLFGFHFGGGGGKVKLRVPKKTRMSYDIDVAAGSVDVRGTDVLEVNKLDADLSAGELKLSNLDAIEIDADLSAGDMTITNVTCQGKTDMDLSAGNVKVTGSDLYQLDADLSLGDFHYELPEPKREIADKYEVDLDVSLGDLRFLDESGADEIKHDARTQTGEKRFFHVDASMGDISIQ